MQIEFPNEIEVLDDASLQQHREVLEHARERATATLTRINREIDRRDVARHVAIQRQVAIEQQIAIEQRANESPPTQEMRSAAAAPGGVAMAIGEGVSIVLPN